MSLLSLPSRILCCWFPDWSVQRLMFQEPNLARCLLVVIESSNRGNFVYQCNDLARRRGVQPGMPASEAETFAKPRDRYVARPLKTNQDTAILTELALRCERYSFCIGLEESERPECLLMDVTGIAHFFTDEETLAAQLQQTLSSRSLETRIAVAGTVGLAWGVARCLERRSPRLILAESDREALVRLPIQCLRIPLATTTKLHRLGIQTIGQLLKLNRASLWSRFGEDLLKRIDQLTGERSERITPCRPLPRFRVKQSLEYGLTQPEAIEQFWLSILQRVVALLAPKRLGTRHLRCRFFMEDRTTHEISVRLCSAEVGSSRLADLLRLQLERQHWTSPLTGIEMEALEVAPPVRPQEEMFSGASHEQHRRLAQLIDRLANRLGTQSVTRATLRANPIPELAFHLVPLTEQRSASPPESLVLPLDRPPALFPTPRPVEAIAVHPDGPPTVLFWQSTRFEIAAHWGPERIEFGWWLGTFVKRDYYRVTTSDGKRLWVFRRLQDDRWFWHGEWF